MSEMSETRRVQTTPLNGWCEVVHGDHCVAIMQDGSLIFTPDQARRLAEILIQQADASEKTYADQ